MTQLTAIRFASDNKAYPIVSHNEERSQTLVSEGCLNAFSPAERKAFEGLVYVKGEPYKMGLLGVEMLRRLHKNHPVQGDSELLTQVKRDFLMAGRKNSYLVSHAGDQVIRTVRVDAILVSTIGGAIGGLAYIFAGLGVALTAKAVPAVNPLAAAMFDKGIFLGPVMTVAAGVGAVVYLRWLDNELEQSMQEVVGPSTKIERSPSIWAFGHPDWALFD